jgi:hypothetical protein
MAKCAGPPKLPLMPATPVTSPAANSPLISWPAPPITRASWSIERPPMLLRVIGKAHGIEGCLAHGQERLLSHSRSDAAEVRIHVLFHETIEALHRVSQCIRRQPGRLGQRRDAVGFFHQRGIVENLLEDSC